MSPHIQMDTITSRYIKIIYPRLKKKMHKFFVQMGGAIALIKNVMFL